MIQNIEALIEKITKELKEFTDIAVIGLSGGADSTLVAILCMLALGKENVYGIHMPCGEADKINFNEKSKKFANYFDIHNLTRDILKPVNYLSPSGNDKRRGNVKARIRMTILYTVSEQVLEKFPDKKVRVIGTDNLSENYLGYFTKFGDGGCDINPIEDLFKSEVYQLLDYFRDKGIILEEHINRVPSAGLWEGQTDEGEMGFTYDEIEECIRYIEMVGNYNTLWITNGALEKVNKMNEQTKHKRNIPPKIDVREFCD